HELVDHPLITPLHREDRAERVPKYVPAPEHLPLRAPECALQVVMGLVPRERPKPGPLTFPHAGKPPRERAGAGLLALVAGRPAARPAAKNLLSLAEEELPAGVGREVLLDDGDQVRRERHAPCRSLGLVALLLVDEDRAALQIQVLELHPEH